MGCLFEMFKIRQQDITRKHDDDRHISSERHRPPALHSNIAHSRIEWCGA
ncbi:hypothetical protein Plhal304r1_c036g0110521 [Plasmopara halstedii]